MTLVRFIVSASVCGLLGSIAAKPLAHSAGTAAQTPASAPAPAAPAQAPAQTAKPVTGPRPVAKVYGEFCATCHGPTLDGGQAPSLLDDTWSFGGDDASLATSIRDGRPGTPMMPFNAALSEQEIRALVIFIQEEGEKARRTKTTIAKPIDGMVVKSEELSFKLESIAEGLDTPWGIAWLPDGRMLVTERIGRLRIIENGKLLPTPVEGVPRVWVMQDGGLMDVAVHPQFATNGWIYLSFSEPASAMDARAAIGREAPPPTPPTSPTARATSASASAANGTPAAPVKQPNGPSTTRIIRARLDGTKLVDHQTLFQALPDLYWTDNTHFGSRFIFDPQGRLYYSIGDRGHERDAQDLASPYGKLHRVRDDGGVPADNPYAARKGVVATIWSYGHRNQQGLAFHPVTGELWSTEHGPRGGDELNLILPGRNYGWPVITHGMNYDGTPITDRTAQEGMEQPVVQWTPSIAACAIEFYTGDRMPRWKHDLFVTALAFRELRRLRLDGHKVVHQEVLFKNIGRVRDIATGPDGYLYVALNEPGRIVRIVPSNP